MENSPKIKDQKIVNKSPDAPMTLQARVFTPIKLKDKSGRQSIMFDLPRTFGFMPRFLHIEKVQGKSNTILVSVLLDEAQLEIQARNLKLPDKVLEEHKKLYKDYCLQSEIQLRQSPSPKSPVMK